MPRQNNARIVNAQTVFKQEKTISKKKNFVFLMRCRVVLVRTDVSEECIATIIRVKGISELRTAIAVTS
jgi:hypothetical protein